MNIDYSKEDSEMFKKKVDRAHITYIKAFIESINTHAEVEICSLIAKETFGFLTKLFKHVNGFKEASSDDYKKWF